MSTKSSSPHQTAGAVVRRDVRAGLLDAAQRSGAGGIGSVLFRVTAAVSVLLAEHAPDRWGRCTRCRRPDSRVGPARRRCRVYALVLEWLQVPVTLLAARLRRDLGLPIPPTPPGRSGARRGLIILGRTPPPPAPRAPTPPPCPPPCPRADLSTPAVSPATSSSPGWCPSGETAGPPRAVTR